MTLSFQNEINRLVHAKLLHFLAFLPLFLFFCWTSLKLRYDKDLLQNILNFYAQLYTDFYYLFQLIFMINFILVFTIVS